MQKKCALLFILFWENTVHSVMFGSFSTSLMCSSYSTSLHQTYCALTSTHDSHWTVSVTGSDCIDEVPTASHTTVPPSASLRTPLKVSLVLSPSLTVTISIPVKTVPVIRTTDAADPLGVNRQPIITAVPFSSPTHWKVAFPPSTTVASCGGLVIVSWARPEQRTSHEALLNGYARTEV